MSKQQTKSQMTKQAAPAKSVNYNDWLAERFKNKPEEALLYLNGMLESPDEPGLFLSSLGEVAKAWGISNLAEITGLNRQNIYEMLSDKGNPRFSSLLTMLDALGLRMEVVKKER
jgi:probable addiction module antidote protein